MLVTRKMIIINCKKYKYNNNDYDDDGFPNSYMALKIKVAFI